MENSQAANFINNLTSEQTTVQDLTGDYLWKALYSHSYTLFFNCAACSHQFDIDGWFYQFDSIICPHCKTEYSGVFGKILPGTVIDQNNSHKNILKLESFDGQEIEIHISTGKSLAKINLDHILLIIFAKIPDKVNKPWCTIDWSEKNAKPIYLQQVSNTVPIKKENDPTSRAKIVIPILLLGILFVVGLFGIYLYM
jgi:hypothetical protein